MKTMVDAKQAHAEIERLATEKAVTEIRRVKTMAIGKVVRQGDIYIHRVEETHSCGDKAETNQLALGNTQGSRHVAESPAVVFAGNAVPTWCDSRTFLGPLIRSDARFTITHPEHAHVSLPPGCYQVTHQLDARSMERVQD